MSHHSIRPFVSIAWRPWWVRVVMAISGHRSGGFFYVKESDEI